MQGTELSAESRSNILYGRPPEIVLVDIPISKVSLEYSIRKARDKSFPSNHNIQFIESITSAYF